MAYAIMGGLAVATVLTLIFLPALYVAWYRIKRPKSEAGQDRPGGGPNMEPKRIDEASERLETVA
jgi:multidrug efflux pump